MTWSNEFVELDKKIHDRQSFDCGEAELNVFLQTQASTHMAVGISRTLLLPAAEPSATQMFLICSFYTITPAVIERKMLPEAKAKKLPHYPVPVFLLAQLAVDVNYRSQGLGKVTLISALRRLWEINAEMRAYAVIVDCLNDTARQFYEKYGFQMLCSHNGRNRLFLPMNTVSQLFN